MFGDRRRLEALKMKSRREFLLQTAGAGLWAAVPKAAAGPDGGSIEEPAGLRRHLRDAMRLGRMPGLQVAVARNGKIVFREALGLADIENPVPVTDSTRFQIASITKAFVGVAVMQLVEAGRLDLAAPVTSCIDGLPSAWRSVKVEHLATHTSGLPDMTTDVGSLRLLVEYDAEASWEKVKTLPLEFAPGEKFNYSQSNYVLLGKIIDAIGGEPFGQFIQRRQLDVVGMPRTVYGDDHDVVPDSARTYTPYEFFKGTFRPTDRIWKAHIEFPPMLRTCGALNSTAGEIAQWLIALEQGKLFAKASSLAELRTARTLNSGALGPWGIGHWISARPRHPVFYAVGAAKAVFASYPGDDLAVVALTNYSSDIGLKFADDIAAHYFRAQ